MIIGYIIIHINTYFYKQTCPIMYIYTLTHSHIYVYTSELIHIYIYSHICIPVNKSGLRLGNTTASCSICLAWDSPAMSSHPTPGLLSTNSFIMDVSYSLRGGGVTVVGRECCLLTAVLVVLLLVVEVLFVFALFLPLSNASDIRSSKCKCFT